MTDRVLILGGQGRIGSSVAQDLIAHTQAQITVTGRQVKPEAAVSQKAQPQVEFLALDLADHEGLRRAIASHNLVIHCAGPFLYRDTSVLKSCIEEGVNYLDVSDNRSFTRKALACSEAAAAADVTAIVNTGIFPGISNSMVRHDVEQLDEAERIHLSYVVAGSGGAGVTVMRTTFLGLQEPFEAWTDNQWQLVKPYSDRETIQFPAPYGKVGVYWFDMPEAFTLVDSFPVKTVITKFGSAPDFYNHLTWIAAHIFPSSWIKNPKGVEFLSQVSHQMTQVSDRFSGIGVAIRSEVKGQKEGKPITVCSTLVHENTAVAAGAGTGSIAQLILTDQLHQPGVCPVEQALSTELFEQTMQSRGIQIH
ncbi:MULTISPECIES: saccharopine dehydrogenase family protein [unclassified Coleofasciculus]|uniref:saccharopine dehydrogenase family protein n=1 Tax=unclassified Coleofasciculus TaxID=2692782 RepID=UPI001882AFAD|nr:MULTISPECIES: saccharopine dehydrogenase NADP-binding domain-containing protein [unclassified Coleofasciculus]MBE9124600.1 saccharopine dehydrogenase NADP-binding domain-containing protein [Coleofasciculus sp. LEGE 07081]MBE9147563.1 saccharopine dehydrogenase NADP-binding domain-containing protein [Coleofasciculus sp. LEGE 07092]